jgi:hypothetical protein
MSITPPYPNGTSLVVGGQVLVVTDHAPHADDWRYTGHPTHLGGKAVHFSHHEARPVPPSGLAPAARDVFEEAELSIVMDAEVPDDALTEVVTAARAAVRHQGRATLDTLRGALLRLDEQTA